MHLLMIYASAPLAVDVPKPPPGNIKIMRNFLFFFVITLAFYGPSLAQTPSDSLRQVWRSPDLPDSTRFEAGKRLAQMAASPEEQRFWLRELEGWTELRSDRDAQLLVWRSLARSYQRSKDIDSARSLLSIALTRAHAWQDPKLTAELHLEQAALEYRQGRFDEADQYYKVVIDQAPPQQVASAWRGKGNIAYRQGLFAEAKSAYLQALRLQQQMGEQADGLDGSWFNLALSLAQVGKPDSALIAHEQARFYAQKKGRTDLISYVYNSLAGIYTDKGNYARALAYADSSLKLAETSGSRIGQAQAKAAISIIYTDQQE